jgi:hypothetical protein
MCGMCGMCVCDCMCVYVLYIIPSLIYPKHVSTLYFFAHMFPLIICLLTYCNGCVVLCGVVLYCVVWCCVVLCGVVLCWECTARELVPAARTQAPPMRFPVLAQRHETQRVALRMSFVRKDALDSLMSHSLFQW